jgi:uncharacterized protein involved in exopolysaccharide biosynthesis
MSSHSETEVNSSSDIAWHPVELLHALRTHIRWWAVSAVVCAFIAAAYSLIAPRDWNATQALIVRPEAASVSEERLGKFSDLSEMKTLQETILELAKSQGVVAATLREVGPPSSYRHPEKWPTALDVEDFRDCVDMRPPGGAEFGKTEVFYLSVRDTNRDRASALAAALCGQLEHRMQQLRDDRAKSMIAELERTVAMAAGDLNGVTKKLSAFEANIGADLNELRSLNAQVGTQGGVSQELQSIDAERRANDAMHRENVRLLKLLAAAESDSHKLIATPSSLLKSQPAVSQLKDALVAAQIRTASLLGSRSEEHPFVLAAREAEQLISKQLHEEIGNAIRSLTVDVELNADRDKALAEKYGAARDRIARLAVSRAEYANLVASVEQHSKLVEAAQKNLADARAHQAGALSASVISRIDGVEAGIRPAGPSRKTITAAGGFAGLLLGVGCVFLFVSPVRPVNTNTPASNAASVETPRATATNGTTNGHVATRGGNSHAAATGGATGNVGFFTGMTLEEAVRSVEQRG